MGGEEEEEEEEEEDDDEGKWQRASGATGCLNSS